jgi:antitoxin ParD1/3/4
MTTLNVSLPDELKKVADQRVSEGKFASHSEYVRSLIRRDQKRIERDKLEARLLERLASGDSTPMSKDDFRKIRNRLQASLKRKTTRAKR